jgi:hypothetical protein
VEDLLRSFGVSEGVVVDTGENVNGVTGPRAEGAQELGETRRGVQDARDTLGNTFGAGGEKIARDHHNGGIVNIGEKGGEVIE